MLTTVGVAQCPGELRAIPGTNALFRKSEMERTMSETHVEPTTNRQNPGGRARTAAATDTQTQVAPPSVPMPRTVESEAVHFDTGHGKTVIAEGVVARIAGIAAREVAGGHDLVPLGATATSAGLAGRLARADQRSTGVDGAAGQRETAVDLH